MFQYKFISQVLGSQRLQKATKLRMTMKTKLKKLGSSEPRLDPSLRTVDTSFQIMETDLPKVGTHPALEASFWNPAHKNWLASNQNGSLPVLHDFPQNRPPSPLEKEQGSHLGRQQSTQTTQDLAQVWLAPQYHCNLHEKGHLIGFEDWSDFFNTNLAQQLSGKLEALEVIKVNLNDKQLEFILGNRER